MNIFTDEECDARQEVMYENYITVVKIEAATMISMVERGILPACREDLKIYASTMPKLAGDRSKVYGAVKTELDKLKALVEKSQQDMKAEATRLCNVVKPQMSALRAQVDLAEGLIDKDLYPYPTYEQLIYAHHS